MNKKRKGPGAKPHMGRWSAIILSAWVLLPSAVIGADDKPADFLALIDDAVEHASSYLGSEKTHAIRNLVGASKAVILLPKETKASLIIGYERGTGIVIRRHGDKWSDPVFLKFSKKSVGIQVGGTVSSVIGCILTNAAVDALIEGTSQLGGEGGFALGGWGIGSGGGGGLKGGLAVLSFSDQSGLSLGSGIEDTHAKPAQEFNEGAYGKDFNMNAVLSKPGEWAPADKLRAVLEDATQRSFWK